MRIPALAVLFWLLAACSGNDDGARLRPQAGLSAELTRTSYGIVHVRANDFAGLGFGLAYAYAQDNVSMLADSLLTVRGEHSRYFGGDAPPTAGSDGEYSVTIDYLNLHNFNLRNEDSDFFFKAYLDPARLAAGYERGGADAAALLAGYAAGYNSYLREQGENLPAACRGAAWVKPITVADVYLLIAENALHATGQLFANEILAAARDEQRGPVGGDVPASTWANEGLGSNAIALGAEASVNGKGLLMANPHFPWFSTDRFYQVHLTVPGVYDAMGVSLGGLPVVVVGFNKDVAWTHTVTKAVHFTTFRLQLDGNDPKGRTCGSSPCPTNGRCHSIRRTPCIRPVVWPRPRWRRCWPHCARRRCNCRRCPCRSMLRWGNARPRCATERVTRSTEGSAMSTASTTRCT